MKKTLLASVALVALTGAAMADVKVGGDGRMGIHYNGADWNFTSRIRISFTASGETDGGLAFGGSIRADNSVAGKDGYGGNVYISGAFGKLSMGDVNSAAEKAVGHVSGVGLTGLGDMNEMSYLGAGAAANDPVLLYEYSAGDFSVYASVSDGAGSPKYAGMGLHAPMAQTYGIAFKYAPGTYSVALGYEKVDGGDSLIALGGSATFGDATIKAVYAMYDIALDDYALSLDYAFGAATATVFYHGFEGGGEVYGLGGSYDLGGGASIKGGIVKPSGADAVMDLGIAMTF